MNTWAAPDVSTWAAPDVPLAEGGPLARFVLHELRRN